MLDNKLCPYCAKSINFEKIENDPFGKSVEHLIPNAVTTRKRKNDEGDFNAHRSCNMKKGSLDELIGKFSRLQSSTPNISLGALRKELESKKNTRFYRALNDDRVRGGENGVNIPNPVSGEEIIDFLTYIAKGLYFKQFAFPLNIKKFEIIPGFIPSQKIKHLESEYEQTNGTNPFRDLEKNNIAKTVDSEYTVLVSENGMKYLIFLHDYTVFNVDVIRKGCTSKGKAIKARRELINLFGGSKKCT